MLCTIILYIYISPVIDNDGLTFLQIIQVAWSGSQSYGPCTNVNLIKELIDVRNGVKWVHIFTFFIFCSFFLFEFVLYAKV